MPGAREPGSGVVLGIVPGRNGAFALIRPDRVEARVTPTQPVPGSRAHYLGMGDVLWALSDENIELAVVKAEGTDPGRAGADTFDHGAWLALLAALGVDDVRFLPDSFYKWSILGHVNADFPTALAHCRREFPEVFLTTPTRSTGSLKAIVAALCLAEHGRNSIMRD